MDPERRIKQRGNLKSGPIKGTIAPGESRSFWNDCGSRGLIGRLREKGTRPATLIGVMVSDVSAYCVIISPVVPPLLPDFGTLS